MNKHKLKEMIHLHDQGYVVSDGWADSYASFGVEDDYCMATINKYYKYRTRVSLETSHTVSAEMAAQYGLSVVGMIQKQAVDSIFQEIYGKIVTDLVRLRHNLYSGQMDRMETMGYVDKMIKALEQE